MDESVRGASRRTVLKVGAWSVPVVAVALGAPGAAASTVSAYYIYQPYAGWVDETLVLEAYVRAVAGDAPVFGATVTWTMVGTGQVFSGVSNNTNGYARATSPADAVLLDPTEVDIAALDATLRIELQGTKPL